MLIILFGLSGAGKNFVGHILEQHFGYYYWDADEALPLEMQKCIDDQKAFTQPMRDHFTNTILQKMVILNKQYHKIVISQALYKESNRISISQQFPEALFIQVCANSNIIKERLIKRSGDNYVEYANKLALNYAAPLLPHVNLLNNNDELSIIHQLKKILG